MQKSLGCMAIRISADSQHQSSASHICSSHPWSCSRKSCSELVGGAAWWMAQNTKPGQWVWPCTPWGLVQFMGDVLLARCSVESEGCAIWKRCHLLVDTDICLRKHLVELLVTRVMNTWFWMSLGRLGVQSPGLSLMKNTAFLKVRMKKRKNKGWSTQWYFRLLKISHKLAHWRTDALSVSGQPDRNLDKQTDRKWCYRGHKPLKAFSAS